MHFKKTTLPNGLRIITVPMSGTNTATVLVMVGTGSKYEEKSENGISHFLEHMAFKGTKKRPSALQIATELDSVGGEYNAFTGYEYTGYWAKVGNSKIDLALDVISDISKNGLLKESDIEIEKGVILEEINMYEDDPRNKLYMVFHELLYGDQPAGKSILGPKDIIKNVYRKDFINYQKQHYTSLNTVVVIAGNIDGDIIIKNISSSFKGLNKSKPKDKIKTIEDKNRDKILIEYKDTNQSHFWLGGYSYKLSDKKRIISEVLFTILGSGMSSRLFTTIREKNGLAYYVKAVNWPQTDTGVYAIRAGVDSNRVEKAIKLSVNEYKKIKNKKVGEKELKKAREIIKGRTLIGLESSDEVAEFFAEQELLENKILTPEEYFAKIDKVTAEQVQEVANDLFTNDNLRLAMIGPHRDEGKFEKILKI